MVHKISNKILFFLCVLGVTLFKFGICMFQASFEWEPGRSHPYRILMFLLGTGIGSSLFAIICVEYVRTIKGFPKLKMLKNFFAGIFAFICSILLAFPLVNLMGIIYFYFSQWSDSFDTYIGWMGYLLSFFCYLFWWPEILIGGEIKNGISLIITSILYSVIWIKYRKRYGKKEVEFMMDNNKKQKKIKFLKSK